MSNFVLKTKRLILLAGDLLLLYAGLYFTLLIRYGYGNNEYDWEKHLSTFSVVFLSWVIIFFINDFYDLKGSYNNVSLFTELSKLFAINAIAAIIIFYFFTPFLSGIRPQKVLIIDIAISMIFLFAWRKLFFNFIKSASIVNRVAIIGQTPLSTSLISEIFKRPQLGYSGTILTSVPDDLKYYCVKNNIDILISTHDLKNNPEALRKIFDCLSLGIDVYNINSFYEQITNKIPVEFIDHSWFLENLTEHSKKFYEISKRIIDIILACIGLIITLPFSPFIAAAVRIKNPGPIIFKQVRVGKNGKNFLAMKFRSMIADAEKNGPQWAQKNDPRVTKFGAFMRKTRLDEIPQLINILKGDMSFVGPRPERPEFIEKLTDKIPFYRERLLVRPGLTGWAQLKGPAYGGSEAETMEKIKYDLYYIKNRSLILDLSIILKTIKVVLAGKGQ